MRILGFMLALTALLSLSGARAQIALPWPGSPASAGGGCTMNGTLVLTNTCNNIYYLMGTI